MNLRFRPFDASTIDDSRAIARWDADPAIRHLLMPFRDEEHFLRIETDAEVWKKWRKFMSSDSREQWIALLDETPVGSGGIEIDPPHSLSVLSARDEHQVTAWLGITVGEARARGRGVGKRLLAHLEERARAMGATHAEAAVFVFNEPSIRLFTGAGYRQFGKVPELTWWNGRMWDELRFLKKLA